MIAVIQAVALVIAAPLLQGFMRRLRAMLQDRHGPPLLQPYFDLVRWFGQESIARPNASWIADAAPGIAIGSAVAFVAAVPLFVGGAFDSVIDVVALVLMLAVARFVLALAALDAGSGFTGMAASREMTFASLAEPVLLLSLLASMSHGGAWQLSTIGRSMYLSTSSTHVPFDIATALGLTAFVIVVIAETARVPVDNQETHYELTMIHEGMLLSYGGWQLGLLHAASYVRQIAFYALAAAMIPGGPFAQITAIVVLGVAVTLIETNYAKLRLFRVPDLIASGALLAFVSLIAGFVGATP